ncbi:putative chitinase 1 [Mercenaria mercenaria]|uniref:putative chitinase 1 n=1 Tax=Mercenaria mercenaria TaxID=6596 RepID=UPI00234F8B02|nr:putative chitinase 1 [Mercenaria mercenaria]
MSIYGPLLTVLLGLFLSCDALKRVCYYGSWTSHLTPEDIDPSLCTHLMFAFSTLDANGTEIIPFESYEPALYLRFTNLKSQNAKLKTMLSLGGWTMGSKLFIELVSSESNMREFASNAITYLRTYNFDGLDIDWEYPAARGSGPEDKANFITLLKIVHNAFVHEAHKEDKPRLLLTAAVGTSEFRVTESYDVHGLSRYLDFINLMMYDFHGQWEDTVNVHSALYSDNDFSIDRFVKYWISEGAPKKKLVIGVPFYGHTFTLADKQQASMGDNSTAGGSMPYYQICQTLTRNDTIHVRLDRERVPYFVYDDQWVGYDDAQSIMEKAQYIRDNGLAGAMVWALDLDDTTGACGDGKFPLMHALKKGLIEGYQVVG